MFLLDKEAKEWYEALVEQTERKIALIITISIISMVVLIIVSASLSWVLSRRIVRPLNEVVNQAEEVAFGNLAVQLADDVNENSHYEVDKLKIAFRNMVENLRQTVSSVDAISVKVNEFSDEVTYQMKNLNEGSQSISEDIQSTASMMNDMMTEFEKNRTESEKSSQASKYALESVELGRQSVQKQLQFATELSSSPQNIKGDVEKFAQYTGEIENAAKSVREIADQTNLLACSP
ncbi:methyl-accepting chemotaxis protein [Bacillus sp. 2205SS5-2]|uniref:methyl-accepting chemotaxis protein n=1 Tax=Bacillus sp. 2205SS5-2 TaxID=3109031 RepID=UPI003004F13A